MLVPANTHLPIAHGASGVTIVSSAMAPSTSMLAQRRVNAFRRAHRIQMPSDVLL